VSDEQVQVQARRPDSEQLVRQWTLLRLLAGTPDSYSVKELAEQLQTSKATIERDLATLEHDFALVEESVGKQKKVYRNVRGLDLHSLLAPRLRSQALPERHAALPGNVTPEWPDTR